MIQLGIDIGGTSVKAAAVRDGAVLWTGKSGSYLRPGRDELKRAIAEAAAQLAGKPDAAGVCVPGILDESRTRVSYSANVPGLMEVSLVELVEVFGAAATKPSVASDANATAYDIYVSRKLSGRLVAIVIGTGVGAAVLDDGGEFLRVDGDSPGHFGQCDVSLDDSPPIGPDAGAGSLEGYIGVPALTAAYGSVENAFREMKVSDPSLRALARMIRIAHAIYRPQHVCLAGGIGIRLAKLTPELREKTNERITQIVRPDWTLISGEHDFHAAIGAARLAGVKRSP